MAALLLVSPGPTRAEPATGFARGEFVAGPYPGGPFTLVNDAVGADFFYDYSPAGGFYGAAAVIGNVEAGFVWGDHDVFRRTGSGLGPAVARQITAPGVTGQVDFHATMVGHVLAGTGYIAASGTGPAALANVAFGMAPAATLWSGAIATAYATGTANIGSFTTTPASTVPVYRQMFQGISGTKADVVNSSYGYGDPAALEPESRAIDALAWENPTVVFVAAAGNGGSNAVVAPGSVFNGITVGSLAGAGSSRAPSGFSSRGAVDFHNPVTGGTLTGVRAAVDIAAPGEQQILAAYLGPTGGLVPLSSLTQNPSPTNEFFVNMQGTSFAAPIVAGGVALMKDAAKFLALFGWMPETALDARVVKAVLMATADETVGWNNGQTTSGGVVRTTQGLDFRTGAGAVDMAAAGITYLQSPTRDVAGSGGGLVAANGWDLGAVARQGTTDYAFDATLSGSTQLQVTLTWFAGGVFDAAGNSGSRTSFANLDLQVWRVVSGSFATLVAESASRYNDAEMLRLTLPAGDYGLRVALPEMIYDSGTTPVTTATYGLAWTTTAVPEPSALVLAATAALVVAAARRRWRDRGKAPHGR